MKQKYARLLSAGIAAVTVLTFAVGGLQGTGGRAMVAFAETSVHTEDTETGLEKHAVETDAAENDDVTKKTVTQETVAKENEEIKKERKEEVAKVLEFVDPNEPKPVKVLEFVDPNEPKPVKVLEFLDPEEAEEMSRKIRTEAESEKREVELSEEDYKVLLKIVQAEAGNCDAKGKLLVANVILNRMESEKFPDTVRDVVYQRHQFSPVSNGSINRCKVTGETVYAVERALNGEDPSEGALYFMNRRASAGSNVRWFDNHLNFLFKHEQHEFFK